MLFPSLANTNQQSGTDGWRDRLRSRLAGNQGSATMPITPYLKGPYYFDLETRRALGIALEMACIALSAGDDDEADHRR